MTSEGLGELFEGDSADTCAGYFRSTDKFEKFEGEIIDLLTISINNSISSEAQGAILSVLEYHGGFEKGIMVDRSASGSSLSLLILKRQAHLILCFQSKISSSTTDISGGSNGVGLKLGPLVRREITPSDTLAP